MTRREVIISGGGTAGHLYPALAVGQKLKEQNPELHLTFVGSSRSLERNIMNQYHANFIPLRIEGIKGKGLKVLKSLILLPPSFFKSLAILIRIKPNLVVGVGGYSSGPIVLLASWMKIPTIILEQNIHPGFTNRLLLPWVKRAVVSFKNSLPSFKGKGIFIGNPAREEFYNLSPKQRNSRLSLLIFGGSQGSHFLNQAMKLTLPLISKERENLRIFHQTGEKDLDWVKTAYLQNGFKDITVAPFFLDMASYFQMADLIISRAGATTIAELISSRRAALLIPFSQASDNHQVLNARELEKIGAAEIILEEEFTPEILAQKILYFLNNKEKINQMEKKLVLMRTENVAEKISNLCFELMGTQ